MKLIPERLEEIRAWVYDKYVCHTEMDTIAFTDLFAHIDVLEAEKEMCATSHRAQNLYVLALEAENKQLRVDWRDLDVMLREMQAGRALVVDDQMKDK